MAMTQRDRQQLMGFLIVLAIGLPVAFWLYWRNPKVAEIAETQQRIDSLENQVRIARADLRQGSVESLRRRVEAYERNLVLMRQLVPTNNEVTNLLDEVSTRAQLRGVEIVNIEPMPRTAGTPYDIYRYGFDVQGLYDQIGEFLTDIASLPRIMVPDEVSVGLANEGALLVEGAEETDETYLQVRFVLRTFVKAEAPPATGAVSGGAGAGS